MKHLKNKPLILIGIFTLPILFTTFANNIVKADKEPGKRDSFPNYKNRGIFGGQNNCKGGDGICVIQY